MKTLAWLAAAVISILLPHIPQAQAASEKVVYSFCSQASCLDGAEPYAGVLLVRHELYVTAQAGGANQWGTLVAVNKRTGAGKVVYSFESAFGDARTPMSTLINVNGTLYGTTADGGAGDGYNGAGTIYAVDPRTGKLNVVYSFCIKEDCLDGALPESDLLAANGLFYGITNDGGSADFCQGPYTGCGVAFSFDPASGKENVLYRFCRRKSCADGSRPAGGLIEINGMLYGTAAEGGKGSGCSDTGQGCGVVFSLDPATGVETVLHTFKGDQDGGTPMATLLNVNGVLYGTTRYGGGVEHCGDYQDGCGTVFSVNPATGAETVLHAFTGEGADGQYPMGALIAVNGRLYGTTEFGGVYGYGTVFSLDPATGAEKVLYSFCSQARCTDGSLPTSTLVAIGGSLYGTTETGGSGTEPDGTVFSLKP